MMHTYLFHPHIFFYKRLMCRSMQLKTEQYTSFTLPQCIHVYTINTENAASCEISDVVLNLICTYVQVCTVPRVTRYIG